MSRIENVRILGALWALALLCSGAHATTLYWVESNFSLPVLVAADTSGATVFTDTFPAGSLPQALAYNTASRRIIYTELSFAGARIRSIGSTSRDTASLLVGQSVVRGIVLNQPSNELYFTSTNLGAGSAISRMNGSGAGYQTLVAFAPASDDEPVAVATDSAGDTVYFTNFGAGAIQKMPATVSTSAITVVSGLAGPAGLAFDADSGALFWTEMNGGIIGRVRLDGTGKSVVVAGANSPNSIALDPAGRRIYWTEFNTSLVKSAKTDGSDIRLVRQTVSPPIAMMVSADIPTLARPGLNRGSVKRTFALSAFTPAGLMGSTMIRYQIPENGHVVLTLYSLQSRKAKVLVDADRAAGSYEVAIPGRKITAGVYLYRMKAGTFDQTKVCTVIR